MSIQHQLPAAPILSPWRPPFSFLALNSATPGTSAKLELGNVCPFLAGFAYIRSLWFVHGVVRVRVSFLFQAGYYLFCCLSTEFRLSTHWLMDGSLGSFNLLAVVRNAALSIDGQLTFEPGYAVANILFRSLGG